MSALPGAAAVTQAPAGAGRAALARAAGFAFVLLALVLAGPIAPMGIATGICGALTLATLLWPPRARWPRTPVAWPMFAWLAALALASAFAVDPGGSWPRITKGLFPLLVGLAALHGADRRTGERALAAYFAASALAGLAGFGVWIAHGASFAARARGLVGHYMTFAGQLTLVLPVALGVALRAREPRWRWGAAATALAVLPALAATFTRSAWLSLFAACGVLLGAVLPWGLAGLLAAGLLAWLFAPGAFGARIHSMFDPSNPWNRERLHMWDAGVRMFRDHPWTGVGLQDLHPLYDQYRSADARERAGHLHNVYVMIAASMGVAGLAAFAWLYTSLVRAAAHGLRRQLAAPGLAGGVRLGVLAALVGFLVAGGFEWNFGDEELLYALYTLAGLAWAAREWDRPAA